MSEAQTGTLSPMDPLEEYLAHARRMGEALKAWALAEPEAFREGLRRADEKAKEHEGMTFAEVVNSWRREDGRPPLTPEEYAVCDFVPDDS